MVMHVSHSFLSPLSFQQRQNGGSPSVRNAILKQPMRRQPWRHRRTGAVQETPPLLEKLFLWGPAPALRSPVAWAPQRRPNGVAQFSCWPVDLLSKHWAQLVAVSWDPNTHRKNSLAFILLVDNLKKLVILSLSRKCVYTTSPVLPASKIPTAADVVSTHSGKEKQQEKANFFETYKETFLCVNFIIVLGVYDLFVQDLTFYYLWNANFFSSLVLSCYEWRTVVSHFLWDWIVVSYLFGFVWVV